MGRLNLKLKKEEKNVLVCFFISGYKKIKKRVKLAARLDLEDTIEFTVEWYKNFQRYQIEKFEWLKFFLNK